MNTAERPSGEGEQIGTDGLSLWKNPNSLSDPIHALTLRVRYDTPIRRSSDRQRESSFHIRLIETGKCHAGVHGNEKRVHVLAAIVLVFVLGDRLSGWRDRRGEIKADVIFPRPKFFFRQQNVSVFGLDRSVLIVYSEVTRGAITIVEQKRSRGFQFKCKFLVSSRCWRVRHQREGEMIANVRDQTSTLSRQFPRNPARCRCETWDSKKKNKREQGQAR